MKRGYTNIPKEEQIATVCQAYEHFCQKALERDSPSHITREFQFHGRNYLQAYGTVMDTKVYVASVNIFMAKIENKILRQSPTKPLAGKRYIDDVFSLWNATRDKIESFISKANNFDSTIKFTIEISETTITFLDTKVYKPGSLSLTCKTAHYNETETFQYSIFFSCISLTGVTKGFIRGEASIRILPFVTQNHLKLSNLENALMGKWHLIQNQPHLRQILTLSCPRGSPLTSKIVWR